jgi:hypothetical protein
VAGYGDKAAPKSVKLARDFGDGVERSSSPGVGPWGPLQSRVKIARRNKSRSIESHSGVQLLWTVGAPVPLEFRGAERSTA